MSEDDLLEEDIWEYKSIRKPKSPCQTSEVTSTNAQESNDEKSTSQSNGSKSNRKISEGKYKPNKRKQRPRQRGIQTSLKQDQNVGVFNSCDHVVQSQERTSSSTKPKRSCKKKSPVNARPVYEGYCPSCQMPFSLLSVQMPQWHVTECLDSAGTAEQECPDGLLCTSTIPSHYKRYSHFLLASSRAGDPLVEFSSSSLGNCFFGPGASQSINCSSTTEDGALKDLNRSMGKSPDCCVLLQQSSSNTNSVDVVNIKTSSLENIQGIHQHRIQFTGGTNQAMSLGPFSQETKGSLHQESQYDSLQLNTLVAKADFSDCDISYSPLNTDEEKSTEEEGEEEEEKETKVKHLRKRLFAVKSPEDRSAKAGSCVLNKPAGTSQQRELEHNSVEVMISDCCETLNIFPIMDGVSKSFSQASISRRILTNNLDLVKHTTEEFPTPLDFKSSGEEFEGLKLSSSIPNAGKCESSNCNSIAKSDTAVKNKLLALKFTEESIQPFQHRQAGSLEKSCSIAKTIPDSCGNTLSHNNSYSIMKKEGRLSNTVTVPVFPSTVSQKLPHVSAAKLKVQAIPAKELKQMDIGVFFGLQPKAKMESDQKKNLCEKTHTLSPPTASGKRSRSRKRKAEGSLGDSDVVMESSRKTPTHAEPAFGGQRRWRKRFRESWTGEGETRKKQCPFYKKIPGTGFVVDAFQYGEIEGCTGYFLTHFHSDHYGGLTKKFTFPIYCNKITGNLVMSKLHVQKQCVHILPMDKECIVNGIKVVLLDANHCPGAAMILFSLPNGTVVLHTGDFRASPSMEHYPFLIGQKVHSLYLDTTYCRPEYTFPSQQEVIQFAVNAAFETVTLTPRTLVVCGTYSIGKEKVFLAIAEILGSKVSVSQEKYKTLQCLESAKINSLITLDWNSTFLHLLPMMQINFKGLQNHLNKFSENFDQILAFKPTGWTYSDRCYSLSEIQPQTRGKITIYGIPYSEHSSFLEMKRFVQWLKPHKIIPTVNVGDWKARNEMEKHFKDWKMGVAGWN
ncbi:PREDICTED: DNA cross-link repair 1A protein isoform X2 [Gekko japonicus]|uniref:DNA cross-link repair 1A protein isoform X2 n=1 Tax=Gekko japonicus TaxID=146911 RepID=A0ABM1L4X8_GEKJA|nr:PREDICTED: DNA cross-link repair 1A protein isoform X2 [Gekko japonicus]